MKTNSLRTRVIVTTLVLLAIVLAVVVTTVTLAYRARLDDDLRNRLTAAGIAVERVGSAATAKQLLPGLALEGIATHFSGSRAAPPAARKAATARSTSRQRGSLLVLDEDLPDGTHVSFSASRASIDATNRARSRR